MRGLYLLTLGVLAAGVAVASRIDTGSAPQDPVLPASATTAAERLAASPRHAEWVVIRSGTDSIMSWVVYPERADQAPVVVVIHEIFGLSGWIRGVADQLAAEGFIAIAPDLLTMRRTGDLTAEWSGDSARAAIRTLGTDEVNRWLSAVAHYGMSLPAAAPSYGVVGFCWGGARSFLHAVHAPGLKAAVVYYGSSPDADQLGSIRAPVLGLYGGNDARITAAVPATDTAMRAAGKPFEWHSYDGAGHGFLRAQDGQDGANLRATRAAWPRTVSFFREHLGR